MTTHTKSQKANDLMQRHVHSVSPDTSLGEVAEFLLKHKVSNAPVVEAQNGYPKLVGFVSERDCLEHLANEAFYGSPAMPQTAQTIMKRHPVCVGPDTELFTLVSVLVHHGFRHVPVVEDDKLLGIVSRRDVLRSLCDYYRRTIDEHHEERFPPDLTQIINTRFVARGR